MLVDGWRNAEDVDLLLADQIEVANSEKDRISLTLDGELREMASPVQFQRVDSAVKIFVPDLSQ